MVKQKTVKLSAREIELIWNALDCYSLEILLRGGSMIEAKELRKLSRCFRNLRWPKWQREAALARRKLAETCKCNSA